MTPRIGSDADRLLERVERALARCLEWSARGRHRKVLSEVERLLPLANDRGSIRARLLVWKAQALVAMGFGERALQAASQSWEIEASPHACHLIAAASASVGEDEQAEEVLRIGWGLFPSAGHLPVQLAMLLADQGRLPEALEVLDSITSPNDLPDELQVFLFGLRANLLATLGRWSEAEVMLREGLRRHPDAELLRDTRDRLLATESRMRAEEALEASWRAALDPLEGVDAEVDDALVRLGVVLEAPELVTTAARRLWRAFRVADPVRPQSPDPWAVAALVAVLELDGLQPSVASAARTVRANPSTVRAAARRVRRWINGLAPEIARRSFAAAANPRLDEPTERPPGRQRSGAVLAFPQPAPPGDS